MKMLHVFLLVVAAVAVDRFLFDGVAFGPIILAARDAVVGGATDLTRMVRYNL